MKNAVEISAFSSDKGVAAGMFNGLRERVRLFGRLLGAGMDLKRVGL